MELQLLKSSDKCSGMNYKEALALRPVPCSSGCLCRLGHLFKMSSPWPLTGTRLSAHTHTPWQLWGGHTTATVGANAQAAFGNMPCCV